jgi:sialic acid synthase SpsE
MTYSIMPMDIMAVENNEVVMNACGSYPFFTKAMVVKVIKQIKKQFPNAQLGLYKGDTWGELELIQEF